MDRMTMAQIYATRIEIERALRGHEDALAIALLDKLAEAERARMARHVLEPELHGGCTCAGDS